MPIGRADRFFDAGLHMLRRLGDDLLGLRQRHRLHGGSPAAALARRLGNHLLDHLIDRSLHAGHSRLRHRPIGHGTLEHRAITRG